MRLIHYELTEAILDENTTFTEWIIESSEIFSEYIQELNGQLAGEEGRFVLSENNKELDLAKKADMVINPFSVDVNSRKILNKLYQELTGLSREEQMYTKTLELFRHIQEYMLDLEQCTSYILEFDQEIDIVALLKAVNVHYEVKDVDFLEKIVQYIKIMAAVAGTKLFVIVNLRSYLTDLQMQNLIQECEYQDIKILFIENQQRSCMKGGKRYIIDIDKCEIY